MVKTKTPRSLAKYLAYILERRPDEFGLVLDKQGYVKIKQLLKALHEEKGWKHVRRFHLNEIMYSLPDPPFEILDNRIRAKRREHLPRPNASPQLPKLLYTCVRKRAYPFVAQKGIFPSGYQQVVLSASPDLAERMGKRSDSQPVLLSVHVQASVEQGVLFQQMGELLFVAPSIPTGCFSGPPLPKEKPRAQKQAQPSKAATPNVSGSFAVNLDKVAGLTGNTAKSSQKESARKGKKERRKKQKRKRERPPWRK
ncbi:MAG: RNA 2'-phosphotransferase [Desulfobacterales bacterium]